MASRQRAHREIEQRLALLGEATHRLTPTGRTARRTPRRSRDQTPIFRESSGGHIFHLTRTDAGDSRLIRHEGAGKVAARPQDHEGIYPPEIIARRRHPKPGPPAAAPCPPQTLPFQ